VPSPIRALVLAAGRGERLRPLTLELPKPLLPIAGRPVVVATLEQLVALGVEATALNLHHLGDRIRGALGEARGPMPLVYSEESNLLGTGGALRPLAGWLADCGSVVLINGDSLCRWPLRRLLDRHRRTGAAVTLLLHRGAEPQRFGGGVAIDNGRVVAFRRGVVAWQAAPRHRVFAGAAVLRPELVGDLPEGPSDIVTALYEPLLAAGETIAALETSRPWFDLGTPERYLEGALTAGLDGLPANGRRVLGDARVAPTARLKRTVIESGAEVSGGARLSRSVVLDGARIGSGARIEQSIVGPGAEVAAGSDHRRRLLTRGPEGVVETALSSEPAAG
jgi:mannose-1-phosphate guanylyltransferase